MQCCVLSTSCFVVFLGEHVVKKKRSSLKNCCPVGSPSWDKVSKSGASMTSRFLQWAWTVSGAPKAVRVLTKCSDLYKLTFATKTCWILEFSGSMHFDSRRFKIFLSILLSFGGRPAKTNDWVKSVATLQNDMQPFTVHNVCRSITDWLKVNRFYYVLLYIQYISILYHLITFCVRAIDLRKSVVLLSYLPAIYS